MRAKLVRNREGLLEVSAENEPDLYWGLGRAHATDRSLQLCFMRLLGRGEISKHLDASDESLELDRFFRRMNWKSERHETEELTPRARLASEAYVEGINSVLGKGPWEMRLLGYSAEPWTLEDCFLISRMAGYLTLAQSQGEVERLLVQMVQAGVTREKLEALFPGNLDGLDEELVRKIALTDRFVPEAVAWRTGGARMAASNNWVVSGEKTRSGAPILANDPHLEINRLPAVWYEVLLSCGDGWALTSGMPGLPGMIIARTRELAWGPTYSFMDAIDSWVEHCRDGRYRRGDDQWHEFRVRHERIERRKKPPVDIVFHENEHGVLDGTPEGESYLLATRWSSASGGAESINALVEIWDATTVEQGMNCLRRLESAMCWVLADTAGNIGFQMSGTMPKRSPGVTGFVPLPGWDAANDWKGMVDPQDLPAVLNPESGWFGTSNQNLNEFGKVAPTNMDQGPYRAQRIASLLEGRSALTVDDMKEIQLDVVSSQVGPFLEILRPMLPSDSVLTNWDGRYDAASKGAFIFEQFYTRLLRRVFGGAAGVGDGVMDFIDEETGLFADFFIFFDGVLLDENSAWFEGCSRDEIFAEVAATLREQDAKPWGDDRQLILEHILLGGRLPRLAGFDRGPITLAGGRATPHQGQIYRSADRQTSFAPSMRFITDMATEEAHTRLCGGASDRRFSKWYANELEGWERGTYKRVQPPGR
jgi:penicillin amidase